jgi:hypothetical protein
LYELEEEMEDYEQERKRIREERELIEFSWVRINLLLE